MVLMLLHLHFFFPENHVGMVIRLPATVVFSAFAAVCMLKFRIGAVISSIRSC